MKIDQLQLLLGGTNFLLETFRAVKAQETSCTGLFAQAFVLLLSEKNNNAI